MNLILGSIIFGLLIGFILGTRIKKDFNLGFNFTVGSYITVIIVVFLVAWQLGNYPYYTDLPLSTAFVSGLIGILLGKLLLGRKSTEIN